jgi:hypothetical protein
MKFFVKEAERKPDPAPIETNPRIAVFVGLGIWVAALVFLLAVPSAVPAAKPWWPWTCVVGIALAGYAFFVVRRRR